MATEKPDEAPELSNVRGEKEKPKPPVGRPFQKGQSGNPGGQSKEKKAVLDILKESAEVFATKLVELAEQGNVEAVKTGLAYLLGKPKERVEVSGPDDGPLQINVNDLTPDELRKLDTLLATVVKDTEEDS